MNEPVQVAPGVWVLHDDADGANSLVVVREGAALVVHTPRPDQETALDQGDEVRAFVQSLGVEESASVGLSRRGLASSDVGEESTGAVFSGDAERVDMPFAGWELLKPRGPGIPLIFNERERILFVGEILTGVGVPSLERGGQDYLDDLARIEALEPKLLVSARGEVAQGKREVRERIERDRQYVYSLQRHVQTALASNIPLQRLVDAARTTYEDYPFVEAHLANLRAVWAEHAESLSDC